MYAKRVEYISKHSYISSSGSPRWTIIYDLFKTLTPAATCGKCGGGGDEMKLSFFYTQLCGLLCRHRRHRYSKSEVSTLAIRFWCRLLLPLVYLSKYTLSRSLYISHHHPAVILFIRPTLPSYSSSPTQPILSYTSHTSNNTLKSPLLSKKK